MATVVLTNGDKAELTPEQMIQNLKNNIHNYKNRTNIDNTFTFQKKINKISKFYLTKDNLKRIKSLKRRHHIASEMSHTLEFNRCDIDEENISYKSHIDYIENKISPILKESMGTTYQSKDGRTHKVTIHWLSWVRERGHLGINVDNF